MNIHSLQLATCVHHIIKHDFPGRWTQIVDKISIYFQNPDSNGWSGALLCLYQLVKNYEYKKADERTPLTEAMNLLLPQLYQLMVGLLADASELSVSLQHRILKIYHALTQYCLPLDLISREVFAQWMEICRQIVERPATETPHIDEDERPALPWWKAKKWALHILARMFERYGSPGNVVNKEYQPFAEWYLPTFTGGVLDALLKVLDSYRNKVYVSPRVITEILNYIKTAVSHAYSWKLIKPHMPAIIQDIIFPIMSFSAADAELWESDPYEYVRSKFDVFEDYATPVPSAQTLFHSCSKKRKGMLPKTMQFVMQIITSPNADASQKDGALHMVGTLADVLLKKKVYRDNMEQMLVAYVFPELQSTHGHMRARACWVLHCFSEIRITNAQFLAEVMRATSNALLTDTELPVKVEAAIAVQMYLTAHEEAAAFLEPQIKSITMELLSIIRETENDDLTNVMQKLVCSFSEQLAPVAAEICQHLASTFSAVLEGEDGSDEKAMTAMGLLNTIETLLSVMEEYPEIMARLHPIVMQVVVHIFQNNIMEFYEETFSLVYDLTTKSVSPDMWQMLELMYQVFKKDGFDYFVDMMPALHNYVTVDTEAFLSNPNYAMAMFDMCKTILTSDPGEDPECHAAKLIEVIILQCKGRIDTCIGSFVELVLGRLTQEVKSSELRTMCLQVVIAALYYNPQLLLEILGKMQSQLPQQGSEPIASHFVRQWIHDTDCFLGIHDRKLYVLGLCSALSLGDGKPPVLNELAEKVLPSLMMVFDGLKRAYQARAQEDEESEDDEEDDDEDCENEALSSDEDEIDEFGGSTYLENVSNFATKKAEEMGMTMTAELRDEDSNDEDDDESDDELEETALESYTTPIDDEDADQPIDEYVAFQQVMASEYFDFVLNLRRHEIDVFAPLLLCADLSTQDPAYYALLTSKLDGNQQKALQEIMVLADQKKAQIHSRQIEKQGGNTFVCSVC